MPRPRPNTSARKRPANFDYQRYLASREWGVKKRAVRERAEGICERCQEAKLRATHHLTYDRLGHEDLDDLLGVCAPCHAWLNGFSDDDPLGDAIRSALAAVREYVDNVAEWLITDGEPDTIDVLHAAVQDLDYRSAWRRVALVAPRVREEEVLALLPRDNWHRAEWEHFFGQLPRRIDAERVLADREKRQAKEFASNG